MYAVVKIAGKQYRVSPGETLAVDKLAVTPGEKVEFPQVLLLADDGQVKIGQPLVEKTKVVAKVLEQFKGEKIRVVRFKAKVRYRRVKGFRPLLSKIQIEKITVTK